MGVERSKVMAGTTGRLLPALLMLVAAAAVLALAGTFLLEGEVRADEAAFKLTVKDHRWDPAELVVPAGKMIKLEIHNADATPEEFESHALNREKIIPGGATVTVYLGALKPGTYEFVGEFHEDTAKGKIVAK